MITISEHARQTLIERYGLAPDACARSTSRVDHDVFTPGECHKAGSCSTPRGRGGTRTTRGCSRRSRGCAGERPDLRLVLTGEGDFGPLPDGVEARGRVSRDELVGLYRGAAALVFPSLYEGFGMPVVEAMACGCPVACSNATSLPEVAGDAARLFDPLDADDIAAAVHDVLRDREPWIERGLARARHFTWDACARAHDEVYRELSSALTLAAEPLELGVDEQRDELLERDLRLPPEPLARLRRIADEVVELGLAALQRLVDVDIRAPVESCVLERALDEVLARCAAHPWR